MLLVAHSRAAAAPSSLAIVGSGTAVVPEDAVTKVINLPGSPQIGDHVLMFWGRDDNIGSVNPVTSGYTAHSNPGGSPGIKVLGKTLSTAETTVEIPGDAVRDLAVIIYVLRNVSSTVLDVAVPLSVTATTAMPDPREIAGLSPGAMVFAVAVQTDRQGTISAFPSGYGNGEQVTTADSTITQGCCLGAAAKLVQAGGTEDPGPFTFDGAAATRAITIAIRPA